MIIAGAGPAGASCAYFLTKRDLKVLILEQFPIPREKPCGGAVPAAVFDMLPFLEKKSFIPLNRIGYSFRGTRFCERQTNSIKIYSVDRELFDAGILKEALKSSSCTLQESQKVTSIEEQDDIVKVATMGGIEYTGKYAVIACGANSALPIRGLYGSRKRRDSGCASVMKIYPDSMDAHIGRAHIDFAYIRKGYAGILPKRDHIALCLYQQALSPGSFLEEMSKRFKNDLGLKGDQSEVSIRAFEVYDPGRRLNTKRTFLAGDAGGLIDPLSGEGIRHAVASAGILADIIDSMSRSEISADEYTRRIHREIGHELAIARNFVIIAHALPAITYGGLINVSEEAGDVLNGALSYSNLLDRLKKRIGRKIGSPLL